MKKIKFIKLIILSILVMCMFGLTEMLFQDHINSFTYAYPYPTSSYALPENQSQDKMNEDMLNTAEKNNVKFFYVDSYMKTDFDGVVDIYYSDESIKDSIAKQDYIKQGYYSTILESREVNFHPISEIKKSDKSKNTYYLIGSNENINAFNVSLADSYGGNPIKKATENEFNNFYPLLSLWAIIIAVFVLLTVYEVQVNKKETAVSISMGEKAGGIFVKNISADILGIAVSYLAAMAAFDYFEIFGFYGDVILISIMCLLIADIGVFSSVFFIKIKNVFAGQVNSKALLGTSYFIKALTTVLTVLIISVSSAAIKQAADFYSQKEFFETKNYSFVGIWFRDKNEQPDNNGQNNSEKEDRFNELLHKKMFKSNNATKMAIGLGEKIYGRDFLVYNQNAGDYLFKNIKDVKADALPENKIILLVPQKYFKDGIEEKDIAEIKSHINFIYDNNDGNYNFEYETVYYKNNTKLLSFAYENYGLSGYSENPIVAYVNFDESLEDSPLKVGRASTAYMLYNITNDELQKLCADCNDELFNGKIEIRSRARSAMDNYMHSRNLLQKTLYGSCFISALLILLEIVLIYYVVKLEYIINAKELALKKIMGYTLFERQKKLILSTIIISTVGLIAAVIINYSLKFSGVAYLLLGGSLTAVVDILVALAFIIKIEKTQITKILKGGAL
ncbi:MAG: DUF1430 domain-containing protein [Oscillospiraceae bacterium]